MRAKLENLIQSDLLHKKQQKLFGVAETRDKALEKTQEAFDRVRTLWTMVERWDEDYHSWIRDDFLSQNANSVDRDVKLYVRGASNLKKKMANPIIDKLWDLTNAMNDKMPLVRELGDPAPRGAELDRRNAPSGQNFTTLELGPVDVDSADVWTNRSLSSSARRTAEELASNPSHARTLKSGRRREFRAGAAARPLGGHLQGARRAVPAGPELHAGPALPRGAPGPPGLHPRRLRRGEEDGDARGGRGVPRGHRRQDRGPRVARQLGRRRRLRRRRRRRGLRRRRRRGGGGV